MKRRTRNTLLIAGLLLIIAGALVAPRVLQTWRYMVGALRLHNGPQFAVRAYAQDHDGWYPPLSSEPGMLMMSGDGIVPEWYDDTSAWTYPGDDAPAEGSGIADHSYLYFGYLITNDDEMEVFAAAYERELGKPKPFSQDIEVPPGSGNFGGDHLYRFRADMEEFLAAQNDISLDNATALLQNAPLIIQRPLNQRPPGGIVAYYDGHSATVAYPGDFPMTERFMNAVTKMDTVSGP